MNFSAILNWFGISYPQPISKETVNRRKQALIRQLVAEHSHGNISLQLGNYITEEDMEEVRRRNANYDFCKKC